MKFFNRIFCLLEWNEEDRSDFQGMGSQINKSINEQCGYGQDKGKSEKLNLKTKLSQNVA